MFISHLYVFFGEMSVYFFGPFFLELSCGSCLYIFEINSSSVASFAIIFFHSEGCVFTLLIVSFVVTWEAPEVFVESGLMWLTLLEEPSSCAPEGGSLGSRHGRETG